MCSVNSHKCIQLIGNHISYRYTYRQLLDYIDIYALLCIVQLSLSIILLWMINILYRIVSNLIHCIITCIGSQLSILKTSFWISKQLEHTCMLMISSVVPYRTAYTYNYIYSVADKFNIRNYFTHSYIVTYVAV